MANWYEPSEEEQQHWKEWVASRPHNVQAVAEKIVPWKLYRMKPHGKRVIPHSIDENEDDTVTLRVDVSGKFNFVAIERRVFGIDPADLEECDLPAPDEQVGTAGLSYESVVALIHFMEGRQIPLTPEELKSAVKNVLLAEKRKEEPS